MKKNSNIVSCLYIVFYAIVIWTIGSTFINNIMNPDMTMIEAFLDIPNTIFLNFK